MRVFEYDRERKRVWFLGGRVHHAVVGIVLIVTGALLVWDDRHDFPWTHDR